MINTYYRVAGHSFLLSFEEGLNIEGLHNYAPFRLSAPVDCLFHLSVTDTLDDETEGEFVGRFDDDIASIIIYKYPNGGFRFLIAYPDTEDYCTMDIDADFKNAHVKFPVNEVYKYFFLDNCLMLLYALSTAQLDTLLIHASIVRKDDEGFVFLGKSGTGKSTHSSLWLKNIAGSELINDDNPVLRMIDGEPYVFGSPWSGKTYCYRNEKVHLKGIVKLKQAPENKMSKLSLIQAYSVVMPACSCMRWENELMTGVHKAVEKLTMNVGCYQLDCLPDREAAELSYNTIARG